MLMMAKKGIFQASLEALYFERKFPKFMSMTLATKSYCVTQIILQVWSCDLSLPTPAFS